MVLSILLEAAATGYGATMGIGYGVAALGAGVAALGGTRNQQNWRRCATGYGGQPEAMNDLRASMILMAALVEGAAFFAMVVGLLVMFMK